MEQPQLTETDVAGIAAYARIALTDEELPQMTSYMNDAVAMLAPLLEFDLEGVEPTFHPIGDLSNVMRPDEQRPGMSIDEALHNAASTRDRSFRVPSILGDGSEA